MKKKLYISICIIFLVIFTITYTVQATTVNEILEEKKNDLTDKIDSTSNEIDVVQGQISQVSSEVQEINEQIAKYQQEIDELNRDLLQLEVGIEDTEKELVQAQENYARQKKILEDRIVAIYKAGETVYLDVLLNSKTLEEFISKYYYLTEIAKRDKQLVDSVSDERREIEVKKLNLLNQQEQLQLMATNKERTSIILKNTKAVRSSYLNQLNEEEQKLQTDLEQYEKEMEELEEDILSISLSSLNEEYIGGELLWPFPGYKTITSPYGMRIHPIFHVKRMHTGVDIGGPEGADIVAVNGGVVTLATYSASYGNYVMIDHGGGVVTLYAHAVELCVSVGDIVKAGDVIMKAGTTGWSTGPHLHFEIRINGNTVNPLPYITDVSTEEIDENLNNIITENNEIENRRKK